MRSVVMGFLVGLATSSMAQAGRIGLSDFDPSATLIDFDEFGHATFLSSEFTALGVVFESGEPSGPESGSTNPNDFLQLGESVSLFVVAITAVPNLSTPSLPNKVIGSKIGAGGELLGYDAASIIITFLDPIPTIAGLHITDPDLNSNASFFGPSGLLDTQIYPGGTLPHVFMGFQDPDGISRIVVKTSIPGGGGSGGIGIDDVRFGNAVPEPSSGVLLVAGIAALARRARGMGA